MTTPDERPDATGRGSEEPTVRTAPAAAPGSPADGASPALRPGWWTAVPRRLGRARTSTVVLAVLFVAVFVLWLNVKPETREARTENPVEVSESTEPTQTEPAETEPTEPTEPTEEPAPTTEQPGPTTRPTSPTTTAPPSPDEDGTGTTTPAPEPTAPAPDGGTGGETAPGS